MKLLIPHGPLDYMIRLAFASRPFEGCGMLGLTQDGEDWKVELIFAGNNVADDPTGNFLLDPADQFKFEREAERRELSIAGFHTHPKSGAWPSDTDEERMADHPDTIFLIIGTVPADDDPDVFEAEGTEVAVGAYRTGEGALERLAIEVV